MKLKKYRIVFAALIFIICLIFIKFNSDLFLTKSFKVVYKNIVYATLDADGNKIIIDSSGQRLIKENPHSGVVFTIKGGKQSGKGFNEATRVITDARNNIYVLSIRKEDGGYKITQEEIVEYSHEGKYMGTAARINHKTPVLVGDIFGLFTISGKFAYITTNEASFSLYSKGGNLISYSGCADAKSLIISYAIDPKTNDIYYSTKQGRIYQYIDAEHSTLLYDAGKVNKQSIPRELSFDPAGNLYFTDIGLRTVSMLGKDGKVSHAIYEGIPGEDISSKYIYYFMNASNGLVAVTSDYIVMLQNKEMATEYGSGYSTKNCVRIIAVWVAVVLMALSAFYILAKFAIVIIKGPKTIKLTMGVVVCVIGIAGVFLLIVLPDFQDRLINSVLRRAQAIADITASSLPIEEFKRIDSTSDYMDDDYKAVRNSVRKIFLSGSNGTSDFYCELYKVKKGITSCAYCLQEDTGAVYPYDWDYEGSDEQSIIQKGEGKVYKGLSSSEGNYLFVYNPIFDDNHKVVGLIEVGTDLNSFKKETNHMVLQLFLHVVAITIVVVMIALEVIIFQRGRAEYRRRRLSALGGGVVKLPNELLRILVFIIFFITNLSTSFLPLYALKIAGKSGVTIPKEVLAAIPISAEVLFGAIFSIMGNTVIKIFGYKKSAVLGSVLFTSGLLVRALVPNIWILTLGNSIMGSGWGILLLIVNTVIAMGDEQEKNQGFAGYSAAALNGVNCGIVFGGFLVNWLSHKAIFFVAIAVSLFVVAHVIIYLTKVSYITQEAKEKGGISFKKFITNKSVLKFFILIVIPVIACSYFLNYLYPILGSDYGLSETKVGYSFLINGLCVICLSDILTQYFATKVKKAYSLVIASLLYCAAFLGVALMQNVLSLIIALLLLGLSDSFGLPLQTSFYTDLDAVKKYGYDKSIGVYSLFENISQCAGSFVFSYVLIIGVKKGLIIVLGAVAVLAVLFGITCFLGSCFGKKKRTVKVLQ